MKSSVSLIMLAGMLLTACSSQEGSSGREAAQEKNAGQPASGTTVDFGTPSVKSGALAENPEQPAKPNRSELRAMAEETKETESSVKNVIERFDANLSDRDARQSAEKEFKAMLPEYKEKMLQIGKAQLQQEK